MTSPVKAETEYPVKTVSLTLRGRKIKEDINGLICLADIHVVAGRPKHQAPNDWTRLPGAVKLIAELAFRNTGISRESAKFSVRPVLYTKTGAGGGTFANPVIALAYAEYLNTSLAIEVREVFLRFKRADPVLADEILQRASPEANIWAGMRALGRGTRNEYTDVLKDHGVTGRGYPMCTDAVYGQVLDGTAKSLRARRNLPPKTNLRDHLNTDELAYIMAAEQLAAGRIKEEEPRGNIPCAEASSRSARFIREAIERDKADRRKRLI